MRTRAAIQLEVNGPLIIDEIELPDPLPGQVIVKHFASGICHSQLHQMHNPALVRPLMMGHEATGVVVARGKDVTHVREGDRVLVTWCPRDGYEGMDEMEQGTVTYRGKPCSWQAAMTWAESTVAHHQYVVKLPDAAPTDVTSIIGCAVMTGFGAVINTAQVQPGKAVVVYGLGGIGLSILQACANVGADPIIAVDLSDEKLAFARNFGATIAINASETNPVEKVVEITKGGADYAFDAIGVPQTMQQVLPSVKVGIPAIREGGMAILVGVPQVPTTLNMRDLFLARTYKGSIGACRPDRDFPLYLEWFKQGKLPLDRLVTTRYKLDQINDACVALQKGEIAGRAIIEYDA